VRPAKFIFWITITVLVCLAGCGGRWQRTWPFWKPSDAPIEAASEDRKPFARSQPVETTRPVSTDRSAGGAVATGPGAAASRPATQGSGPATRPVDSDDAKIVAGSILQVNDRFITADEVVRRCGPRLQRLAAGISRETFRREAARVVTEQLHRLVRDALLLSQAERWLTDQRKQQVEKELQETLRLMIVQAGGSRLALERRLQKQGTTLDEALEDYRKDLTIQSYLRSKFYPQIVITRRMLLDEYQRRLAKYTTPKKVQMQIICALTKSFLSDVSSQPAERREQIARELARRRIDQAVSALEAGDEFADVARRYSCGPKANSGGLWPVMAAGNFRVKQVEDAAFQLQEGQTSGVIEADDGFYIVRAERVVPARIVTFEQAQSEIENDLRERKYQQLAARYMTQLLKEATIVESRRFVTLAVDLAVERYWRGRS